MLRQAGATPGAGISDNRRDGQHRPSDRAGLDIPSSRGSLAGAHACRLGDGLPGQGADAAELVEHILSRLHLVPRYRQRLAYVPLGQGRPVWADDPHFNPRYHIRHTALPKPADDAALKRLAGRIFSQRLDRSKPLWEIWLVQSLSGNRFALVAKTHHALVDGISGVDITTVLFDTAREPAPTGAAGAVERQAAARAGEAAGRGPARTLDGPERDARGARALLRAPRRAAAQVRDGLASIGATTIAGISAPAPPSPFNVDIGPHRRYTFLDADLDTSKRSRTGSAGRSTTPCWRR